MPNPARHLEARAGCPKVVRSGPTPIRFRPTVVLAVLSLAVAAAPLAAQFASAERGAKVLQEQCRRCHSGDGGEDSLSELARPSQRFTPTSLTAQMWTHGPQTWRLLEERDLPAPRLSQTDIRDLFAYFYDLQYFDPSGDAGQGERVFQQKRCKGCHSPTIPDSERAGPSVSEWPMISDAVRWSELMWNHAAAMIDAAGDAGVRWPRLTVQDMMDLLVYLENVSRESSERSTLVLSDPDLGEKLFRQRSCSECHTLGEKTPDKKDLLVATRKLKTLVEFAVAMWNHSPRMAERAQRRGVEFPRFEPGEMSHVVSLLFVRQYFESEGNEERGREVFANRTCAHCHDNQDSAAPPLRGTPQRLSTARLAAAAWQHGPEMFAAIEERALEWPTLSEQDVADLIAYLNR